MTMHAGPPRTRRGLLLTVTATALIALGLAACGSSSGYGSSATGANSTTTTTTASAGEYGSTPSGETSPGASVVAKDFSLTSASVAVGTQVTFENTGPSTHTMTADDGSFDTDRVAPGSSAKVTAPSTPGSYTFHCKIHPSMTGTLTVTG